MEESTEKTNRTPAASGLDRRELLKGMGAGVAAAAAAATPVAAAQQAGGRAATAPAQRRTLGPPTGTLAPISEYAITELQQFPQIAGSRYVPASVNTGWTVRTGPGWKNDSGRASGNGPMDESTRRLVDWVYDFKFSDISPSCLHSINNTLIDTMTTMFCGYESEPGRIAARICQTVPGPVTEWGHGLKTSIEMAAFTNGLKIRHADFDGPHNNEMFGGPLAVGETLHSSGQDMMVAMAICYEIVAAIGNAGKGNYDPDGWDCPFHGTATALACAKLMGLNKDQMANAVALALVPHMPLYVCHIGTQSMWKGTHSAETVKNGTWAALLARAGMTGPYAPFENRDGLWRHLGPPVRDLVLPTSPDGRLAIETVGHGEGRGFKRYASEGNTQGYWEFIAKPMAAWAKPEEIAQIDIVHTYFGFQEICDPQRWDPRNRETADHSMPYNVAHGMLHNGEVYIDSFTKENYMDPRAREIMNKTYATVNMDADAQSTLPWITLTKKSGEKKEFRCEGQRKPLSQQDLLDKYQRSADYWELTKDESSKILNAWSNIKDVKDIGEPISLLAKFGKPRPLSDMTPAKIS